MAPSLAASNGAARITASVEADAPGGISRQTGRTGRIWRIPCDSSASEGSSSVMATALARFRTSTVDEAPLTEGGSRPITTERLSEAVTALRAAQRRYSREKAPLEWAMLQNNLGNALAALGVRERGIDSFEAAIAAYRGALEVYTRSRSPLEWAMTHNNLGAALRNIGIREASRTRIEEAVAAYQEALKEYRVERVPLDWAMTQHNLGAALRSLGEREPGTARLDEAVAAYRQALRVRTR
jgi:tetratricopeptide (TPR) repeat protein